MSRALFLAKLKQGLAGLPQPEIDEIAADYEFHFSEAAATGQSDDDIVARLGDPARLARELREQRGSADDAALPLPPPRPGGRAIMLLALLVLGGGALAAYLIWRDTAAPPPALAPQPVLAAPHGARIVIGGGQVLDLGAIAQERIEIVVDGGGRATARGKVKELTLRIDGSGSAELGALAADSVHVELSGTGHAEVSGAQAADVTISGSGTVRLKVKPKTLKQSVTGSGQVLLPD